MASDPFTIRAATVDDCATIARHRAWMFRDMGSAVADVVEPLRALTEVRVREMFTRGEYAGWLAVRADDPAHAVSGVGIHLRLVQPFPIRNPDGSGEIANGRQGLVVNVYTEAEYRRRGLAKRLMIAMMEFARDARLDAVVLHAAPNGRPLYESLGFRQTNEMRFQGKIAEWRVPTHG